MVHILYLLPVTPGALRSRRAGDARKGRAEGDERREEEPG